METEKAHFSEEELIRKLEEKGSNFQLKDVPENQRSLKVCMAAMGGYI